MMSGMGMMVWGVFSFLLGLLLIFVFVVAIAAAVKWLWGQKFPFATTGSENALDILKKRYVKGRSARESFNS